MGLVMVPVMRCRPATGPVDPFDNPTPFEQLLGNNG